MKKKQREKPKPTLGDIMDHFTRSSNQFKGQKGLETSIIDS
jgi:hypothetical protein